ncbi:DNA ligase [Catenovulum sp. 2E275]|uniref:DNA ligase n=1 Tax=Catenovulum sp. 2E275 TaxID=2980497 RepID=UPI0021D179DE|nr:DNA ligase [Catenovulum sp. 2E275]MCU4676468.1 DNA ligase [Catenovulum sp. 2E275]
MDRLKLFFWIWVFVVFPAIAKPSQLMLANVYNDSIDLADYWVSEKYDGVRAYWDGQKLWSRAGNLIKAPAFFTQNFPKQALDGELWIARGQFAKVSGIIRRDNPDKQWQQVKYMVFDLPGSADIFDQRLEQLNLLFSDNSSDYIKLVPQFKVKNHQALQHLLDDYVRQGSEGLMLHKGSSYYQKIRSDDLLKLKQFIDADAVVIEHLPGQGKYAGMLGALLVKDENGVVFKIGTGFSDEERKTPPIIGSVISFKYTGRTKSGLPRFPVFLREKLDQDL